MSRWLKIKLEKNTWKNKKNYKQNGIERNHLQRDIDGEIRSDIFNFLICHVKKPFSNQIEGKKERIAAGFIRIEEKENAVCRNRITSICMHKKWETNSWMWKIRVDIVRLTNSSFVSVANEISN